MSVLLRLFVMVVLLASGISGLLAGTAEEVFDEGHEAYVEGRFEEAYGLFMEAARHGVRDPRLEFNLGNAAFKTGRLGEAVLHFGRAVRWDPGDQDARRNLQLAQSFALDRVEAVPSPPILAGMTRILERLGPDRIMVGLLLCWWALLVLATLVFSGRQRFRAWMGWISALLLLVMLVGGGAWKWTLQRLDGSHEAVVMTEVADVLADPGRPNATLFTVHEGLLVEIRAENDDWVQIRLTDGLSGWIQRSMLEPL